MNHYFLIFLLCHLDISYNFSPSDSPFLLLIKNNGSRIKKMDFVSFFRIPYLINTTLNHVNSALKFWWRILLFQIPIIFSFYLHYFVSYDTQTKTCWNLLHSKFGLNPTTFWKWSTFRKGSGKSLNKEQKIMAQTTTNRIESLTFM